MSRSGGCPFGVETVVYLATFTPALNLGARILDMVMIPMVSDVPYLPGCGSHIALVPTESSWVWSPKEAIFSTSVHRQANTAGESVKLSVWITFIS